MKHHPVHNLVARQDGVSLIELMITLVVALLLLGGLIQVYLSNKQSYNAQEQLARMQESGRFAMDLITTDLRRAGYWGGSVSLPRIERGTPGPISPDHICNNDDEWGRMIRWRVSGTENARGNYACADGYDTGIQSDILTIRYAGPSPVTSLTPTALYLKDNTESGAIMTGSGDIDSDNDPLPIAGDDVPAAIRPLVSNGYYIGDSGRTCASGDAIPALMRVRLNGSGVPEEEEIASGVERFEVQYLRGKQNQYEDAQSVEAANGWLDVKAVRVWLLVRGECPEQGLNDDKKYELADEVVYEPADNFRRQLYVSTVMLRNLKIGDAGG